MGRLKVFAPVTVDLTPTNQFVINACTGRSERSTVVVRRSGQKTILSRRSVLLSAKHLKTVVLTVSSQKTTRYRVTVGIGIARASVVILVHPAAG